MKRKRKMNMAEAIVVMTDNHQCEEFLRKENPAWLSMKSHGTMPTGDAKLEATVIIAIGWKPKRGVCVFFFGQGCMEGDDGWAIITFPAETQEIFTRMAPLLIDNMLKPMKAIVKHVIPSDISQN